MSVKIHAFGNVGQKSFSCHVGDDVTLDGIVDNFGDYFGLGYARIGFDSATAVVSTDGQSVQISGGGLYRGKVNNVRYFDFPVLAVFDIGKGSTSILLKKLDGTMLLSDSLPTKSYDVLETPTP